MSEPRLGPSGRQLASIQIHASRRCNLRCLHCYSSSGPEQTETLALDCLRAALNDAAEEGYRHLSLSGGEPLLYRPLKELLAAGKARGILTTLTTNGMLLDQRRRAQIRDLVDLVAISLDGTPASHDRMRAAPRAFAIMQRNLLDLRAEGIPFGFIFTLTQYNLDELDWVADFALAAGARLLQIHPLEECGHAARMLAGEAPDRRERTMAFLEFLRIQARAGDRMHVQLDLADSVALRQRPEHVYADDLASDPAAEPLAALVAPLVVESDGSVVPLQHGFPRAHALGNLHDRPLRELAQSWKAHGCARFQALCRRTFDKVTGDPGRDSLPFVNWYEILAAEGRAASPAVAERPPAALAR